MKKQTEKNISNVTANKRKGRGASKRLRKNDKSQMGKSGITLSSIEDGIKDDRKEIELSIGEKKVLKRLSEVKEMVGSGFTEKEVAIQLGIDRTTLYRYKLNMPQLREALEKAKVEAGISVTRKMFERINGTTLTQIKKERPILRYEKVNLGTDKKPRWKVYPVYSEELVVIEEVIKETPASDLMIMYYLNNKFSDIFTHSNNNRGDNEVDVPPEFEKMSPEEMDAYIKKKEKEIQSNTSKVGKR